MINNTIFLVFSRIILGFIIYIPIYLLITKRNEIRIKSIIIGSLATIVSCCLIEFPLVYLLKNHPGLVYIYDKKVLLFSLIVALYIVFSLYVNFIMRLNPENSRKDVMIIWIVISVFYSIILFFHV